MTSKLKAFVGVAALVAILGQGCPGRKAEQPAMEEKKDGGAAMEGKAPIKLGFIGPLTGDAASLGQASKAAVELAVEEINAKGGVDGRLMVVIYEDGQCNAKEATNAANKLMNVDKVDAIIGGLCSTETSAFGPTAMENKMVTVSYCSSAPNLSELGKYFFRTYPSDAFQGKFGAEYAYNTLNARKVAIVYHISAWGTGIKNVFEENFKKLGGEVVFVDGAPQEARDYRTILAKVKEAEADLVYAPTYPEGGIVLIKQARDLGIETRMLGGDAWGDPKLWDEVKGSTGILLYTLPIAEYAEAFTAKLLAKTNVEQVSVCSPQAYDAIYVVADAVKKAGTDDADALVQALRETSYEGVSGKIEFNEYGDVTIAEYKVQKIEKGVAKDLE